MKVNTLPASTWRWLKVNSLNIDEPGNIKSYRPEREIPGVINTDKCGEIEARGGLGTEFDRWIAESGVEADHFGISGDTKCDEPVYMSYDPEKSGVNVVPSNSDGSLVSPDGLECYVNRNQFSLAENSSFEVIQFIGGLSEGAGSKDSAGSAYASEVDDKAGSAVTVGHGQTGGLVISNRYDIKDRARLKLIQIINLPSAMHLINDNGGICADNASFELVQIVLGGGHTVMGDFCSLSGQKSSYNCEIAYYLTGSHDLDMNYVADHTGQKTVSNINVSGVMSDTSSKLFRGTINFHNGCAQSKGSELEEVLLMNDGVINKTVPLILCDEEDVEGNHGASIGRLDENLIFYLASRGMDIDEIYKTMARARVDRVASRIRNKRTCDMIGAILGDSADSGDKD